MSTTTKDLRSDLLDICKSLCMCAICHDSVKDPVRPICGCNSVYCFACAKGDWTFKQPGSRNAKREGVCPHCQTKLIDVLNDKVGDARKFDR